MKRYTNNFNLIRIIAATQVLIIHACNHFGYDSFFINLLRCFPGVPIFFFTSGYLIGNTYIKNHNKGLKTFFRNRFLRLYPALWICIIISVTIVFLSGYFNNHTFNIFHFIIWNLGQMSFFQFYNPEFMREYGVGVLNGSLWTIAIEVQFYVLTPILYFLLKKHKPLIIVILLLSIISNLWLRYNYDWTNIVIKLISVSFLPWIYMFLLGYLASYYKKQKEFLLSKSNVWLILLLYVLAMNLFGNYESNASNSINPIAVLLLCIIILKFAHTNLRLPEKVQSFLHSYDLSYGIYIYHMPIINLFLYLNIYALSINIFLTILLTFLFAYLSWIFIERRALQLKK